MGVPCALQNVNSTPGLCPLDAGRTAWAVIPKPVLGLCQVPPGGKGGKQHSVESHQSRLICLKVEWVESPYSSVFTWTLTQILPLETKLGELDVVEVSIISSKVQQPRRIWIWL